MKDEVRVNRETGSVDFGDTHLGTIVDKHVVLQGDLATQGVVDRAVAKCEEYGAKCEVYHAP